MVAPIRFLSGRQQQQKIGVEGSTENEKVLEVVGRAGIGTTIFDPSTELEVRGDVQVTGISTFKGNVTIEEDYKLYFGNNPLENLAIYQDSATTDSFIEELGNAGSLNIKASSSSNPIKIIGGSSNDTLAEFKVDGGVELYYDDSIKFATSSGGIRLYNGLSGDTSTISGPENIVIDPDAVGNTGVVRIKGDLYVDGTNFIVDSETITLADFVVGIASTATTNLLADGAGIEIGTSDINLKYYHNSGINSSLKSSLNLNVADGKVYQINQTERLSADTLSLGTGTTIHSPDSNTLTLGTNGNEYVRIDSTGNFGINRTNPSAKLDVNGTVKISDLTTLSANLIFDNDSDIKLKDNGVVFLGTGDDFRIYHNGNDSNSYIDNRTGHIYIRNNVDDDDGGNIYLQAKNGEDGIVINDDGSVELYYDNSRKLETLGVGVTIFGNTETQTLTVSGLSTFTGSADFNGSIDVDGLAELDDVNVSGASTFTGAADFNGSIDVDGLAELDDVNVSGASTFTGSADFNGSIDVDGLAELDDVNVSGASTFTGDADFNGSIDVDGLAELDDVNVSGASTFNDINVSGLSTFTGAADFNGSIDVDGLTELDDVNVSGASTFTGAADFNGSIDVDGLAELDDVNVSGASTFTGDADFNSSIDVTGLTTTGQLYVSGVSTFRDDITILLDTSSSIGIGTTVFTPTSNFIVDVRGDVNVEGQLLVNGTDIQDSVISQTGIFTSFNADFVRVSIAATFESSTDVKFENGFNVTAGSVGIGTDNPLQTLQIGTPDNVFVVTSVGDVGIGTTNPNSDLDVLGYTKLENLSVSGLSTFTGAADFNGSIDVDGLAELDDVNVSGASTFTGDADFNGSIDVDGLTELDDVNVSGASTFTGAADFNGSIDVDGLTELDDVNVSGASTFTGAIDANGGIDVTGLTTTGQLYVSGLSTFTGAADFNGSIDVDGLAELDDVNVSGASTFTGVIDANGDLDVDGHTELDNVNVAGIATFNSNIVIDTNSVYGSISTSFTTTDAVGIHSALAIGTYRSVEYTIQATEGSNYHSTKVLTIHDGTTAYHSEYGTIYSSNSVATFDVDISGGNIRLLATAASASSTEYVVNFVATKV